MTIYAFNPATGELIRTSTVAGWMGATEAAPPDFDPAAAGCFWRGDRWEIEQAVPQTPPAPEVATMRQARLALHRAGLLSTVDAAIAGLPEPGRTEAQIEWEYAQEVRRDSPLVSMLGAALELDDAKLDALFVDAVRL